MDIAQGGAHPVAKALGLKAFDDHGQVRPWARLHQD
jgi:hypothetical protein